jgi:hypothetical protein
MAMRVGNERRTMSSVKIKHALTTVATLSGEPPRYSRRQSMRYFACDFSAFDFRLVMNC